MHSICFFYKLIGKSNLYSGKYMSNKLPLLHDGLDTVIIPKLWYGINKHRFLLDKKKDIVKKEDINIGILSAYSHKDFYYSSEGETSMFNFYFTENDKGKVKIYINGKLLNRL